MSSDPVIVDCHVGVTYFNPATEQMLDNYQHEVQASVEDGCLDVVLTNIRQSGQDAVISIALTTDLLEALRSVAPSDA